MQGDIFRLNTICSWAKKYRKLTGFTEIRKKLPTSSEKNKIHHRLEYVAFDLVFGTKYRIKEFEPQSMRWSKSQHFSYFSTSMSISVLNLLCQYL